MTSNKIQIQITRSTSELHDTGGRWHVEVGGKDVTSFGFIGLHEERTMLEKAETVALGIAHGFTLAREAMRLPKVDHTQIFRHKLALRARGRTQNDVQQHG